MASSSNSRLEELLSLRNRLLAGTLDGMERARFAALAGKLEHHAAVPLLEDLLDDPLDIVRYNALSSLVLRLGKRSPEMIEKCWRRFEEDEDGDVRRMALACLASIYFDSFDIAFFDRMEQMLRSPELDEDLLETAYQALFEVVGLPPTEWPDRRWSREPMTRQEIDWMKVAKLRARVEAEVRRRRETGEPSDTPSR